MGELGKKQTWWWEWAAYILSYDINYTRFELGRGEGPVMTWEASGGPRVKTLEHDEKLTEM